MTTDIGNLPTQKQVDWLYENRDDILRDVWDVGRYGLGEIMAKPHRLRRADYLAIMHKVTMAADVTDNGPARDGPDEGCWRHPANTLSFRGWPTRFQAELAALGAPEEVVNDG